MFLRRHETHACRHVHDHVAYCMSTWPKDPHVMLQAHRPAIPEAPRQSSPPSTPRFEQNGFMVHEAHVGGQYTHRGAAWKLKLEESLHTFKKMWRVHELTQSILHASPERMTTAMWGEAPVSHRGQWACSRVDMRNKTHGRFVLHREHLTRARYAKKDAQAFDLYL